jgi:hypothetical protein
MARSSIAGGKTAAPRARKASRTSLAPPAFRPLQLAKLVDAGDQGKTGAGVQLSSG